MLRFALCLSVSTSICFVLFALIPQAPSGLSGGGWIILANIFGLMLRLLWNASSPKERSAEYVFYIYMTLFYLLPGYVQASQNRFPFYDLSYPGYYVMAAAIAVLAFSISFAVGYKLTESYSREENIVLRPAVRPGWSGGLILIPVLYASLGLVIALVAGIQFYVTPRGEIEKLFDVITPLWNILLTSPRILSFVALAVSLIVLKRRASGWALCSCIYSATVFALVNSPLAIPRYVLFAYLITLMIVFSSIMAQRKVLLLALWFIAQLTIFPAVSALSRGDIADYFSTPLLRYYFFDGDFDGFQSTINVLIYAEKTGLHWGLNLLSAILFFVPRVYWESKIRGTGGDAALFMGYDFINVSAPLPSEFYVDFGFIGVIVGGTLLGHILAKIDRAIREARRSKDELWLFTGATVVGYLFILLRGSLVGVVGPFVLTYAIVWVTRRLASGVERSRRLGAVAAWSP
jgi:oligosaccharide repeat unit polymerase